MNSSTLRRSNITREKMAVLSALSEYNAAKGRAGILADKQAELDMLWQNFKIVASSDKSPKMYFAAGFFTGVVVSLAVAAFMSFFIGYSPLNDVDFSASKPAKKENVKFTFIPADKQAPQDEETVKPLEKEYTVQAGDSLEDISMRFYGSFDKAKLKQIQEKNNLKDLNSINIGQKLIIPAN